jgi:hypothetical protein
MIELWGFCVRFTRHGTVITLLTALGLIVPAYIGSFLSGVPTVFSPLPALTVIPLLMLVEWHLDYAVVLIPVLLFLLWNPQLFREEGKIPKRSYVLFALLVVLSVVDFSVSWKWGLKYQGPPYTAIVCSINIAWLGFLALAFGRTLKMATTFRTSLFLHWMLFAWLCWYAFPWLGELI